MRWPRLPKYYPGWWLSNPGGAGGLGTVQTDGVTIQGDGSAGNKIAIKAVQTTTGLTGLGTVASKLGLSPSIGWFSGGTGNAATVVTANQIVLCAQVIPFTLTFANISWLNQVGDNANNCDVGLYNSAGTLVANIGAQHIAFGAGVATVAAVQGSQTIQQGLYFSAYTSAAGNFSLFQQGSGLVPYFNGAFGSSVGGALPASIVPPALSAAQNCTLFGLW